MSEAARSRRDDTRYEPQMAAPGRDASQGHADPLAELARLVGQDDPFRSVFRPASPGMAAERTADGEGPRYLRDAPYPVGGEPHGTEATHDGHEHHHDDGHGHADPAYDGHAYADGYHHDPAHADAAHHGHDAHHGQHAYDDRGYDDRAYAAEHEAHHDYAAYADERYATEAAAASTLPDIWAQSGDGAEAGGPSLAHGEIRDGIGADRRSSPRRPLAVLAAVLVLTGGGLAASFLVKGPSTPGAAAAGSGRTAPTIMAATGPTKVKVEGANATAPEDQDAALLNKNGNVSSGPVKIVSSQEQPVDLGQLPRTSDLADGARPLPAPTPSPFPEPKKVKTFVVHPDGTMLSADGAPSSTAGGVAAAPDGSGSALPATPKTASNGGTTPRSAAPADAIAALTALPTDAAGAAPARPARQPASPGAKLASAKPNDTADAPTASAGGYGVQLASSPVEADANAAFAKLKKRFPTQLGALTASVHKAETGDKPVYRVRVGSMSQDDAKALCAQLQGAGGSCFVVHN